MLVELTNVPPQAVPVARLKEHLRLGSGFADDAVQEGLLAGFLRAAMAAIEGRTGKALVTRDFRLARARARASARGGVIALPLAPVSAVIEVARLDGDGGERVLSAGDWRLEPDAHAPGVVTGAGLYRVDFTAGWGAEFSDLPDDLQQAVMMLAAHYYEYRHDVALSAGCTPFGVTSLLERWHMPRLGGWGAA